MTEYLVLLKLDPAKISKAVNSLRDLPEKPSPGVDLQYIMHVFGNWDVAMWFNSDNSNKAVDFIQKKINSISGVVDAYAVPTFPNTKPQAGRDSATANETPEKKPTADE